MDKHNYKLTQEDKKALTLDYYLNRTKTNISALCTKYNISESYLYRIVKDNKNKELVKSDILSSKENFSKRVDKIISTALSKLETKLDNDDMDKTTYRDIAIMIGTLYDKSRLEKNLSTENKAIEINIKVEK